MASEPVEELPDDLEAWVAERAAADDTSRAEVVRRLMAAHRLLDEQPDRLDGMAGTGGDPVAAGPNGIDADSLAAEIDGLDARIDDLTDRVGGVEADLDEKIADIRDRVIQVKRETDAKAPADHGHPELADRMDERLERLEDRVDEGFENYEEVLEYLTQRADDLADDADDRGAKLRNVANAVVDLRKRVSTIESVVEERAAVAALRESANRQGIAEAACGSCGESVRLGLLNEPACPHCESPFGGIEPGGWFRSAQLTVGDVPALAAGTTDSANRTTPGDPDAMAPGEAGDSSESSGAAPPNGTGDGSENDGVVEVGADPSADVWSKTGMNTSTDINPDGDSVAETDATPDADTPDDVASDDPAERHPAEDLEAVDFSGGAVDDVEADTDGSDPEATDR